MAANPQRMADAIFILRTDVGEERQEDSLSLDLLHYHPLSLYLFPQSCRMPPSRFGSVSAYRNATLTAFNPTERYEELSTSSTSTSNQDVPLTCSLTHLISLNSSPGVINYIRHSNTGKHSNKSPSFNAINGNITDLKVTPYFHSTFNSQLLAVSNQSDSVNVYSLPYTSQDGSDGIQSELREEEKPILVTSFQVENAAQISNLSWHPNAQDLLLVSSSTSNFLVIYHLENGKNPNVAIRLEVDSPVWNADWSQDGKFIVASSKDGLVRVWNPREIQKPLVVSMKTYFCKRREA